eukprot:Pgem_evm1s2458
MVAKHSKNILERKEDLCSLISIFSLQNILRMLCNHSVFNTCLIVVYIVNHEASVIDLIQENVSTAILKEIDDFATARWNYLALLYTVHNDCESCTGQYIRDTPATYFSHNSFRPRIVVVGSCQ